MYEIEKIVVGDWQANCYLLTSNNQMVVIDPGAEASRLIKRLRTHQKAGIEIVALLSTHGHSDHIGAVNELREEFKVPYYLHPDDQMMAAHPELSGFADEGKDYRVTQIDAYLEEGKQFSFGSDSFQIFHLPGHTPGSICLLDEQNRNFFTGDVLFRNSVGRTDFVLGNGQQMRKSCQRLTTFPKDLQVFPGHGPYTRMGWEIENNPFLTGVIKR